MHASNMHETCIQTVPVAELLLLTSYHCSLYANAVVNDVKGVHRWEGHLAPGTPPVSPAGG